jgi:hypothetical protein
VLIVRGVHAGPGATALTLISRSARDNAIVRLRLMKRHSGLHRAQALIALANRSVGSQQAAQAYKLHLKQLLAEYDLACEQLQVVEQEIATVLERIPFAKSMLEKC